MTGKVIVAGVDMVKFVKPGEQEPYRVMAARAIQGALNDADIDASLTGLRMGSDEWGQSKVPE